MNNYNNYMSLRLHARAGNESFARSCVAAFCTSLNPTVDQLNDIKTAVSEAVTNSIIHAGLKEDDLITINVELVGNLIHIKVIDDGIGIDNIKQAREPFYTTKADEERTGMGFLLLDAFMDSLDVDSKSGKGVTISMKKAIG